MQAWHVVAFFFHSIDGSKERKETKRIDLSPLLGTDDVCYLVHLVRVTVADTASQFGVLFRLGPFSLLFSLSDLLYCMYVYLSAVFLSVVNAASVSGSVSGSL